MGAVPRTGNMDGTSKSRELASTNGSTAARVAECNGLSTELHVRLWSHAPVQDRPQWPSWKSDCIPVHMISDLVAACNGVLLPDAQDRLAARFDSPHEAISAAKRIQWALLGFFQDQPLRPVAAAILVDTAAGELSRPDEAAAAGTKSSLASSKPAQILVAEAIYEQLSGVPGLEFRNFGVGGVYELVWASPDTYRLWEDALNPPIASEPVPVEENHSATRILQAPVNSAAPEREPAFQPKAGLGQASESSYGAGMSTNDLFGPSTRTGRHASTGTAISSSNDSPANFHLRKGRSLLAVAAVVAILAMALLGIVVHKNAAARQLADQQMETSKVATAAPVVQPPVQATHPPDPPVLRPETAPAPAGHPSERIDGQGRSERQRRCSRGRKAQRDRKAKTQSDRAKRRGRKAKRG